MNPGQPRPAPRQQNDDSQISTLERAIIDGINRERQKAGRAALRPSAALMRAARKHTQRMANERFFDHRDPDGKNVSQRVTAEGYRWSTVGENIAQNGGYADPTARAVEGWMNSPGHKRNILNGDFTETGVGVVKVGRTYYFTQVFGRPR